MLMRIQCGNGHYLINTDHVVSVRACEATSPQSLPTVAIKLSDGRTMYVEGTLSDFENGYGSTIDYHDERKAYINWRTDNGK